MSSSGLRRSVSAITEGLPIPELINSIRHSFRECEYDEVRNVLMDHEKKTRVEMENLVKDRDLIKEELRLLEKTHSLTYLKNLKTEEKLERSLKECEELKRTIKKLEEKKGVSSDRQIKVENMYNEVSACNSKIDEALLKMGEEIEGLRKEKLDAKEAAAELRRENVEAKREMDELMKKKLESDMECEAYKSKLDELEPRIMKIEEALSSIFNVKVEDLKNFVEDVEKSAAIKEEENFDFRDDKNGGRKSVDYQTKDGCSNEVQKSPVSHSGFNSPQEQKNVIDLENEANGGPHGSASHAGHLSKLDIIELSDSDVETGPTGAAHTSDTVLKGENAAENEIIFKKSVQTSRSKKLNRTDNKEDSLLNTGTKRKRNVRSGIRESTLDKIGAHDSEVSPCKISRLVDDESSSTDSEDESDSDSCIEKLVATIQSENLDATLQSEKVVATRQSEKVGRKFMLEAEMIKALQEDEELCMNGVCALYRQQFFSSQPTTKRSKLSKTVKPDDLISARALAEYLIDGDNEMRLRKSVSEVKNERAEVISQCRRLSVIYSEKLFEIYCSAKDPFFARTT
ncbi:hypothetical protein ACP275_05G112000 [Erythranthe tilingii]